MLENTTVKRNFLLPNEHSIRNKRTSPPTAQGGDVLLLRIDDDCAELECIQCKHYAEAQTQESWWSSLGVNFAENDITPTNGSAGYSYAGLVAFQTLIEERISMKVELGFRTLALSFKAPQTAKIALPENKKTRVWFREMLEPTISTFELGPAVETEDN